MICLIPLLKVDWKNDFNCPPIEWPEDGDIIFQNYSTRYRQELDLSLKNITCHVKGSEKVVDGNRR